MSGLGTYIDALTVVCNLFIVVIPLCMCVRFLRCVMLWYIVECSIAVFCNQCEQDLPSLH